MSEDVKYALATGASTGIGETTARCLRELGWDVAAVARREERLAALVAKTGYKYVAADLSDETAVGALATRALEGGLVDVLVSNAGDALGVDTIAYADSDRWIAIYHRSIMTVLRIIQAFLSGTRERGGNLVFLTSTAAHDTCPGGEGHVAAKHAECIIASTLRQELVGESVRIVEIVSGMVKTSEFSLNRLSPEETAARVYEGVAEPLLADDVADAICWTLTRLARVNIDPMILRPVVQATNTLLTRQGWRRLLDVERRPR